jgi:hypothetical protein
MTPELSLTTRDEEERDVNQRLVHLQPTESSTLAWNVTPTVVGLCIPWQLLPAMPASSSA